MMFNNKKSVFMKAKLYLFILISFSHFLSASAQQAPVSVSLPEGVSGSWYSGASEQIRHLEYDFHSLANNEFRVVNPVNHVGFLLNRAGYSAYPLQDNSSKIAWTTRFTFKTIGREIPQFQFSNGRFSKKGNILLQSFGFADVEYHNNEKGLRQNFIINEKARGTGNLKIEIQLQSTLDARIADKTRLAFYSTGNDHRVKLIYEDLKVWDATKKVLMAHMELNKKSNVLSILVDDRNAVYPVTVDPLNKTPEWTTSADGILPSLLNNLNLQVQSLYGYTVTGLGDINNDGYDDVAVGAPGMADVVSGSGTLLGVGAVFIYLGSPSGLSTIPNKVIQPNTAPAGAMFGSSIAAGNLTADGINDLIIGAPLDTYQTTAGGLLGPVNVNLTAGKVYLYRSEDLFLGPNPSPFLEMRLQGANFFSTGVAGLLLRNVGIKGLF